MYSRKIRVCATLETLIPNPSPTEKRCGRREFRGAFYGFTLLELMMAITLSTFILLGLTTMLLTSHGVYSTQIAINTIADNARDVSQILLDAIHSSKNRITLSQDMKMTIQGMNTYFIADTGRIDMHHDHIFALYVQDVHAHKTELVEGINDWNITLDERNGLPVGVSIELTLSSVGRFKLHKSWFIYAAV